MFSISHIRQWNKRGYFYTIYFSIGHDQHIFDQYYRRVQYDNIEMIEYLQRNI